uniref:Uncharacterized protein n=1 Tax=Romanomermis culicivorax TaxID=13658 RepID=A0A915JU31_ROMCU
MNWFLIGCSLIGSNFGGEHLVGLAGSGAASGVGVANFEIQAVVLFVMLGWIFVPVYFASGVVFDLGRALAKIG